MRGRPAVPEIDRFMTKFQIDPVTGCWNWIAGIDKHGYGRFYFGGRKGGKAHQFAYLHFTGPLPEGQLPDHKCRNRRCVNPEHLQPLSMVENIMTGVGVGALNAKKTHCPKGHPYSPTNTYIDKRGYRYCRACRRQTVNKNAAKNTANYRARHGVYWSRSQGCYIKKQ